MRNYLRLEGGVVALGHRELNDLMEYYRDRYDPAELVEHLDITIDDLLDALVGWFENNEDKVQEDLEHITGYREDI